MPIHNEKLISYSINSDIYKCEFLRSYTYILNISDIKYMGGKNVKGIYLRR